METTKAAAESRIKELLKEAFDGARVFQAGGNEILGNSLQEMILEAANNSLQRLYPQFHIADHPHWSKVYEKAQKGAPDSLKLVGDDGEVPRNPVCKAVLQSIGAGKKGADIRQLFESAPYGWSRDAIDGALQALIVAGHVRATNEQGKPLELKEMERKSIGKNFFKVESATVTAAQRIKIRQLFQQLEINAKTGEEISHVSRFLEALNQLANRAGGDAPKPPRPDTSFLEEIRLASGNEQLIALHNMHETLVERIGNWRNLAQRIDTRMPEWSNLERLARHATSLHNAAALQAQAKTIEEQRQLLDDPNPIAPLVSNLTQLLRDELNRLKEQFDHEWTNGDNSLEDDLNWAKLEPEQRYDLRTKQHLIEASKPEIQVNDTPAILHSIEKVNIASLRDRIAALPSRFSAIRMEAAKLCEPKAQFINLPSRTLKNDADVKAWLDEVSQLLYTAVKNSPVIVK